MYSSYVLLSNSNTQTTVTTPGQCRIATPTLPLHDNHPKARHPNAAFLPTQPSPTTPLSKKQRSKQDNSQQPKRIPNRLQRSANTADNRRIRRRLRRGPRCRTRRLGAPRTTCRRRCHCRPVSNPSNSQPVFTEKNLPPALPPLALPPPPPAFAAHSATNVSFPSNFFNFSAHLAPPRIPSPSVVVVVAFTPNLTFSLSFSSFLQSSQSPPQPPPVVVVPLTCDAHMATNVSLPRSAASSGAAAAALAWSSSARVGSPWDLAARAAGSEARAAREVRRARRWHWDEGEVLLWLRARVEVAPRERRRRGVVGFILSVGGGVKKECGWWWCKECGL